MKFSLLLILVITLNTQAIAGGTFAQSTRYPRKDSMNFKFVQEPFSRNIDIIPRSKDYPFTELMEHLNSTCRILNTALNELQNLSIDLENPSADFAYERAWNFTTFDTVEKSLSSLIDLHSREYVVQYYNRYTIPSLSFNESSILLNNARTETRIAETEIKTACNESRLKGYKPARKLLKMSRQRILTALENVMEVSTIITAEQIKNLNDFKNTVEKVEKGITSLRDTSILIITRMNGQKAEETASATYIMSGILLEQTAAIEAFGRQLASRNLLMAGFEDYSLPIIPDGRSISDLALKISRNINDIRENIYQKFNEGGTYRFNPAVESDKIISITAEVLDHLNSLMTQHDLLKKRSTMIENF